MQLLAERVLGAEALELSDKRLVTAECEVGLDALFERREADLVEAPDRRPGKRLRGEVRERLPAPQIERRPKELGCALGLSADERVAGLFGGALESAQIELVGLELNHVAGRARLDRRLGAEHLAQLRDLPLDLGDRGDRRSACVEILGEPLDRDDPVRVEEQDREDCALLGPPEQKRAALACDFERSQDPEVEHGRTVVVGLGTTMSDC